MSKPPTNPSLSYKDAGVNIDAGNDLVEKIKGVAKSTRRTGVLSGLGGFGALFEVPTGYQNPVLVSGTDGVGTKLKLAIEHNTHNTIGIDLVAMCANDIIVTGAEPLYFLDYYATAKLDVATAASVVEGIGTGCKQAGAALIGGETAEMPGMYHQGDYDLAGFCVGIVEKSKIIDGSQVQDGDALVALASSGPHSNGYSLIRKVLEVHSVNPQEETLDSEPLLQKLMAPTRIYVKSILQLFENNLQINAISHITGGGLTENIPRVIPDHLQAVINTSSWTIPPVFEWLKEKGNIAQEEMYRTFNCGVGMILVIPKSQLDETLTELNNAGERCWEIGHIKSSEQSQPEVDFVHSES